MRGCFILLVVVVLRVVCMLLSFLLSRFGFFLVETLEIALVD